MPESSQPMNSKVTGSSKYLVKVKARLRQAIWEADNAGMTLSEINEYIDDVWVESLASEQLPEHGATSALFYELCGIIIKILEEADLLVSKAHDIIWASYPEWEGENGRREALSNIMWELHSLLRGESNASI